jgi:integrase
VDSMEILSVWRSWLDASYAPATAEGYWGAVIRFVSANPVPLPSVTDAMIAAWIESFPALRNLFSWMVRHGHIDRDPTADIRVPSPEEKEPRALTVEQYEAVRDAAYAHNPIRGYAVELLYYSGGRIGETLALTWDRVTADGIIFAQTKNGKERTVPWSEGLMRAVDGLRGHFGEQQRVLPRAEQTVWLWMREAGKDAGVPRVHPHLFRATTATRAHQRGASAPVVQRLLGHAKLTTTSRYLAVDREEIAKAVGLL